MTTKSETSRRRRILWVAIFTGVAWAITGAVGFAIAMTSGEWITAVIAVHAALTVAMLVAFSLLMFFVNPDTPKLEEATPDEWHRVTQLHLARQKRMRMRSVHDFRGFVAIPAENGSFKSRRNQG